MKKTLLAVVVSLSLVGCGGVTPEEAVSRGQDALNAADMRGASIEFKTALQEKPNMVEARLGLAKIALMSRNFDGALSELEKAEKFADESFMDEITRLKARIMQQSEGYLALLGMDNRNIPEVIYYQVLNSLGKNGDTNPAELIPSKSMDPFINLARYAIGIADLPPAEALATFPAMEDGSEAYVSEYNLLKSRLALGANEMDMAIDALLSYINLNPSDISRKLQISNMMVFNGQFEDAKPYLSELVKQFPQQGMINDLWAVVNYEEGNYEVAQSAASMANIADPRAVRPRLVGAYSAVRLNEPAEALEGLEFIIEELPTNHPAQRLYIRLKAGAGDADDVTERALAIDELEQEDAALLSSLGMEAARRGDAITAQRLAEKATQADSNDSTLGLLQLTLNQDEQAFETLEKAFETDSSSAVAGNSLASAYLSRGRFDEALALADKWIAEDRFVEGYMLSAVVKSRQGDIAEANKLFQKTLEIEPENFMARAGVVESLVQLDKAEEAKVQLKAWIQDEGMLPLYRNYVSAIRAKDDSETSVAAAAVNLEGWMQEGIVSGPESRFLVGQTYFLARNPKKANEYLDPLVSEFGERRDYWLLRSNIAEQLDDVAGAESAYVSWQLIAPADPMPLMGQVRIASAQGDFDRAADILETGLGSIENDLPGRIILAQIYIKTGNRPAFRSLVGNLPDNIKTGTPVGIALVGVTDAMAGRFDQAVSKMKPFVEETANEDLLRWLVSAMERSSQPEAQKGMLIGLIEKSPQSPLINFMLGNLFAAEGDFENAAASYQKILTVTDGNALVLNNLAYVQLQLGMIDDAMVNAEKTIKLAPGNPSFVDTYASVLIAQGKNAEAVVVMQELLDSGVQVNETFKATLDKAKANN